MNTETITVHPKNDGFEIVVQHDQTGSAYGIDLSKDAYEQLRLHFVVGQSEQCRGCEESTGETKLWCCNHCGKRIEDW